MLWPAVVSVLVLKLAVVTPPPVDNVPVPSVVKPSLKEIGRAGWRAGALIAEVAVSLEEKETHWPETEGCTEENTVVVGAPAGRDGGGWRGGGGGVLGGGGWPVCAGDWCLVLCSSPPP